MRMKWYTHLTGMTLILSTISRFFPLDIGTILFALSGSILPDILESLLLLEHRSKYMHNVATAITMLPLGLFSPWFLFLVIGYIHHLILDATTVTGIYIGNHQVKGTLKTDNLLHNIFIVLIHLLLLFLAISYQ